MKTKLPSAPSLDDYFSAGSFDASTAVARLGRPGKLRFGERRLLSTALLSWVVAPGKVDLMESLLALEIDKLVQSKRCAMEKKSGRRHGDEFIFVLMAQPTQWLYDAYIHLDVSQKLKTGKRSEEVRAAFKVNALHAVFLSDIMRILHENSKRMQSNGGKSSLSLTTAIKVTSQRITNGSTTLFAPTVATGTQGPKSKETLRTEIWMQRRPSAAWCYALATSTEGKESSIVRIARTGRAPILKADEIIRAAGVAHCFQETVLRQLRGPATNGIMFDFPAHLRTT